MNVCFANKNWFKVYCGTDPHLISIVSKISGRHFVAMERCWLISSSPANAKHLHDNGFVLDEAVRNLLPYEPKTKLELTVTKPQKEIILPPLLKTPRKFQKEAVQFFEDNNGLCLLGDEMGLGKTISALAWAAYRSDLKKILIICPASLKLNWERELKQTIPKSKSHVISGRTTYPLPHDARFFIINYAIIWNWMDELINYGIDAMIIDECHNIKNDQTKQTKATVYIGNTSNHVIGLSGTPLVNRPIEFFNFLKLVRPDLFKNKFQYAIRYCKAHKTRFGWNMNGASNTKELHSILIDNGIMLRRMKSEVLKDLPPIVRTVIPLDINNRKEYREELLSVKNWTTNNINDIKENKKKIEGLAKLQALRKKAVLGKMDGVFEWLDNFLDSDQKIIVFGWHLDILDMVEDRYKKIVVRIDGSTPIDKRQKYVDLFQNDKRVRMFAGNIKAAKEGLTLTAASNECFIETTWSPGDQDQAEGRAHRIGQKDSVNVWYFVAKDTIEEDILSAVDSKRKVISNVIDGKDAPEDMILMDILYKIQRERV